MAKDLMPVFLENLEKMALGPREKVLIAVSGGPDSMALLHLFLRWDSTRIGVFHLNHGFRAEAGKEAKFVEDYARQYGIATHIEVYNINQYLLESGESKQQGARTIRYKLLDKCAQQYGYQRIASGHHGDDQAETILMRLFRGSGLRGLAGIRPVRGPYIRPLLNISKQDLIAYCHTYQVPYVEDETNLQPIYLRNKIRVELLPLLIDEYNPQIATELIQLADLIREDDLELERQAKKLCCQHSSLRGEQICFPRDIFQGLSIAMQRRVLRRLLELYLGNLLNIDFKHVENWRTKLVENSTFQLDLPGVEVSATKFGIFVGEFSGIGFDKRLLPVPGQLQAGEFLISAEMFKIDQLPPPLEESEDFDLAKLSLPLFVRPRLPGDRLKLFGGAGTKKVKDLFIDCHIPAAQRDYYPIICDQRGILWIPSVRRGETGALGGKTQQVVRLKFARTKV